jgi:Polysaccharide pyruvyl transferase
VMLMAEPMQDSMQKSMHDPSQDNQVTGANDIWTGSIPLSWARASEEVPFANLGDALSALIVGAISGHAVSHADFDSGTERMIGIGTIVQDQRAGVLHLWGSGMDGTVNPLDPTSTHYAPPPDVSFRVHAVRGPRTAGVLRRCGIAVPPVYGDPAWFLPKILPRRLFPEPTHELGVITHISELAELTPASEQLGEYVRYAIPETMRSEVRLINTLIPPTLDALIAKIGEILSCRRILSASFHGLVLPLAYGVPALTFGFPGEGFRHVDAADAEVLDHRFSDFFQGIGLRTVPVAFSVRDEPTTDWHALMRIIDREHIQPGWTGRDLFEAFPGRKAVRFDDPSWPVPAAFRRNFLF